ncbi:MAG TPA: zf-TFIIB domain-containing protein [Candidatus Acidoferrales bacterium]|nr:zf-TFIIB domain-containing protein [Candidatus Acidoferrales bacterium]
MDDEKDRFGELLRLLERAREDVYFSARDRELIEKLRQRLREAQKPAAEAAILVCPECQGKLQSSTFKDFPTYVCASCGGTWLHRGELEEIFAKAPRRSLPSLLGKLRRGQVHA